jgi:hypothetical protein
MRALDRRAVLRGGGAVLALPLLEAMLPRVRAQGAAAATDAARGALAAPRRAIWVYAPNGVNREAWRPGGPGDLGALGATLEPLEPWRARLLAISGLALDAARAHGDGPGDHARANAAYLTCAHPLKADGAVRAATSIDQLAARDVGSLTRFRSLQLGCEEGARAGQCDSGYACAYSGNLSWSAPTTPLPKETDPARLFDRLFREGVLDESPEERAARRARRSSVLDLAREQARALGARLGAADRRRLDEYETAVRELERRLARAEEAAGLADDASRPAAAPKDRSGHAALLSDVLALALATDSTRIATFALGNEGSNKSHREVDVPEGHHETSHHGGDPAKREKVARIDRLHVACLAHLVRRLAETPDGDVTLLERTLVVYGSGIGDGDRHDHGGLPILALGGPVRGGRHLALPKETPLANLHLAAARWLGADVPRFGDSSGTLELG